MTRALTEGDPIDLGDVGPRVLHLPGHSPGSVALWDAQRGRLLTGDVVYDDELLDELTGADIAAYVTSMRRLLELEVNVVHPGHGASFDGRRLKEIVRDYIARRG